MGRVGGRSRESANTRCFLKEVGGGLKMDVQPEIHYPPVKKGPKL